MGRREDRAALRSTWTVYEPKQAGIPFRKKDIEDALERERANAMGPPERPPTLTLDPPRGPDLSAALPRMLIASLSR